MRRTTQLLATLFLLLAAAVAATGAHAQTADSKWHDWEPATTPDGSAHPTIQFRWRSDPPCTQDGACQLAVQIRNIAKTPARLHCKVFYDPPPSPFDDELRPVTIDVRLKAFGGSRTGSPKAGDTTSTLVVTGTLITGVVVQRPKP